MTDKDEKFLKSQVNGWIEGLLEDGTLSENERGDIEYTQDWLNKQLFEDWCLECGYNTLELMYILKCFEEYRSEKEITTENITYEAYDAEYDEIYREYESETEIIEMATKKVA